MWLSRTLADMKSHVRYQVDQLEHFYYANVILDMEKAELETDVQVLHFKNEALQ